MKKLNSYLDELTFLLKKSLIPPTKKTRTYGARLSFQNSIFTARLRRAINQGDIRGARFPPLFTTFPRLQMYTFNETFTKTTERDLQKIYKFYKNHQSCQELQNFANFTKTTWRDLQKKYKIYKNSSPQAENLKDILSSRLVGINIQVGTKSRGRN